LGRERPTQRAAAAEQPRLHPPSQVQHTCIQSYVCLYVYSCLFINGNTPTAADCISRSRCDIHFYMCMCVRTYIDVYAFVVIGLLGTGEAYSTGGSSGAAPGATCMYIYIYKYIYIYASVCVCVRIYVYIWLCIYVLTRWGRERPTRQIPAAEQHQVRHTGYHTTYLYISIYVYTYTWKLGRLRAGRVRRRRLNWVNPRGYPEGDRIRKVEVHLRRVRVNREVRIYMSMHLRRSACWGRGVPMYLSHSKRKQRCRHKVQQTCIYVYACAYVYIDVYQVNPRGLLWIDTLIGLTSPYLVGRQQWIGHGCTHRPRCNIYRCIYI